MLIDFATATPIATGTSIANKREYGRKGGGKRGGYKLRNQTKGEPNPRVSDLVEKR